MGTKRHWARTPARVAVGNVVWLLLFLAALVPAGLGPALRNCGRPSPSRTRSLPAGSQGIVSRASGYPCRCFDAFALAIDRRWPAPLPNPGDVLIFRLPREHATRYIKRVVGLLGDPHPDGQSAAVDHPRTGA